METYWLKQSGSSRLAVFVLGWAADWQILTGSFPEGCDVLAVYDFCVVEPLVIQSYPESYLYAWSFGVMASEYIFGNHRFTKKIALNGTPRPVDECFGIDPRRMAATLRGIEKGGMEVFERRAYGEYYDTLRDKLSPRGIDANIKELNELCVLAANPLEPKQPWDRAIVGIRDKIFPPENQLAYWGSVAELISIPHYPFSAGESLWLPPMV